MNQKCCICDHSVSVVIPVYNGQNFLDEAIRSVLRQTIPPREILVIDDGSTDRTPQIAAAFGNSIHYFRQQRQGPPAARNFGISQATSEWVSMLDSDDVWPDNSLELQLAPAETDPAIQIVVGYALLWPGRNGERASLLNPLPQEPQLILNLGSAIIRRPLFAKLGTLNTQLFYCDDWDWFMRVRELQIPMHIHRGLVLYYRRHAGNLTNNRKLDNHFLVQMLKQSLNRRRMASGGIAHSLPYLQDQGCDPEHEEQGL